MTKADSLDKLIDDIQYNCDVSDAADHGIYSMCTMVLKLRNLYKWEHGLEPWDEPEPAVLLDWIDAKEHYWERIRERQFRQLSIEDHSYSADAIEPINQFLREHGLLYGAGYGRSMKAVFFLAEKIEEREVAGCRVAILGREIVKEMASPFAMAQQGVAYIRKDSLRYFLWDQIQELRGTKRASLRRMFELYGLLAGEELDQRIFRNRLDEIVENELELFIFHEVGEILQKTLDSDTLNTIARAFPDSLIELVCRSVKDILADTHPEGVLHNLFRQRKESSLSFYVGLLDGLRKQLFPEIVQAWCQFSDGAGWQVIEGARINCRKRQLGLAAEIKEIAARLNEESRENCQREFNTRIIAPLGLKLPGEAPA